MKINFLSKDISKVNELKDLAKKFGFQFSEENPEIVVCMGGDGMFLIADKYFPSAKKLLIKKSRIGNKCQDISVESALDLLKRKKYLVEKIERLEAISFGRFGKKKIVGVNDIVIRNTLPTEALRFRVNINGRNIGDVFIGDGIVISTGYGSGAYFNSITRKPFSKGIGIAFNNPTIQQEPIFLRRGGEVKLSLLRGPGVLVADNNRNFIQLEKGDTILIRPNRTFAERIILEKTENKH